MPSPIGHALGGLAVAWSANLLLSLRSRLGRVFLPAVCAGLAALPDIDLMFRFHRTATHSLSAMLVVFIVAGIVTAQVTSRPWRVALICAAAYGSHLLLDWLAVDNNDPAGIQLLWPFSHRWFISGWDVFKQTERNNVFSTFAISRNAAALLSELTILGPIAALLYWALAVKRRARRLQPRTSRQESAPSGLEPPDSPQYR